jgi:site-specific DNA-methyltransferase (adenine-specific)
MVSKPFLLQGDCLDTLWMLEECSVDALITDPPAGIHFMSKAWDDDKGGA